MENDNNVKSYKLRNGDVFCCDIFYPPIGKTVKILGIRCYYMRKWYNPFSWFKKHWCVEYEYVDKIDDKCKPLGNLSPSEIPTELHDYKFERI